MSKFNLFFTVFLLSLAPLPASAMFARMRSAFKPLAAATARRLTAPRIAGLAVGAAALYGQVDNMRSSPINVDQRYPNLRKFIERNRCAKDLEQLIQREGGNTQPARAGTSREVFEYSRIPYWNKGKTPNAFSRLENARRMKIIFEQSGIESFGVADKCLCNIGDEWHVIATAVAKGEVHPGLKNGPYKIYSKKEIEELFVICSKTAFTDWGPNNLIVDWRGREIIVDTEERSFVHGVVFRWDVWKMYVTKDVTREWFENTLSKYKTYTDSHEDLPLNHPMYDDPGIDFEEVKKEFRLWEKEMAQQKTPGREVG